MPKQRSYAPLVSLLIWLTLMLNFWPESPLSLDYVRIILVGAPLLIVPFCVGENEIGQWRVIGLGALFGLGMLLSPNWLSIGLVLPWLLFSIWLTWRHYVATVTWTLSSIMRIAQPAFLFVAACWATADRLQIEPLGFTGDIVLLTAVHFHYAGFALTWLATKAKQLPDWSRWGIVAGVGLVALGITTSQYDLPAWIEVISVSTLVFSALRLAWALQFTGSGWSRLAFGLAGLCLSFGMLLALAYGWRYYFPLPALNIPTMYAIHGSLNSLGFALPATWAFLLDQRG